MSESDRRGGLALCFGTRPQVIKAAVLLSVLRSRWPVITVDTGQHYDFELNGLLYQQLEVPRPDHFLEVGSGDPAAQTAAVLTRTAEVLARHRPAAVLVIGDTNSTLGCALAASKAALPLVHIEAGLRSNEPGLPEEANRRVVDVLGGLLCAPSRRCAERLHAEGVPGAVVTTGDVARDILNRSLRLAPPPDATEPFALATIHRAALTGNETILRAVVEALGRIGMPVVFPVHPRTRAALEQYGLMTAVPPSVTLRAPLGYFETIAAIRDAAVVVTDSGGLQREAYWLGTPCVTLRGETEWVETVDCGANVLLPPDAASEHLARIVADQLGRPRDVAWPKDAYGEGRAADLVADAIGERFSP
ncbi:MAG: UDP-N-acetyl glucosamine 2-epimerase [Gemmatimonadales bacterium]